jgi:cytoskeletal protein RodZ
MNEFGEKLKKERESRGITLEVIAESTKVSKRYLTALESGQFNILPGGVINKGIVRSYARVVGLKEEKWVNHFMAAYSQSDQLTDDDASWIAFAENVKKGRPQSDPPTLRLKWTGAAVLVVLLVTIGWLVWHFTENKTTAQAYAPQPAVTMLVIGAGNPSSPLPSHR